MFQFFGAWGEPSGEIAPPGKNLLFRDPSLRANKNVAFHCLNPALTP